MQAAVDQVRWDPVNIFLLGEALLVRRGRHETETRQALLSSAGSCYRVLQRRRARRTGLDLERIIHRLYHLFKGRVSLRWAEQGKWSELRVATLAATRQQRTGLPLRPGHDDNRGFICGSAANGGTARM